MAEEDLSGGMLSELKSSSLLRWEVKPIWIVSYPSEIVGAPEKSFTLFGVDRGSLDITRNWEKVNSVEQFGQGWVAKPMDLVFTVAVKERTEQFEKLRRLGKTATIFDIRCDVLRRLSKENATITHGSNQHNFPVQEEDFIHWLDGFEKYIGCIVNREGQTVDMATIPVREFEILFLRHDILEGISTAFEDKTGREGDGSFPTLDELGI